MPSNLAEKIEIEEPVTAETAETPVTSEAVQESNPDEAQLGASRAEELRLLEALLFASDAPLDEGSLKKKLPEASPVKPYEKPIENGSEVTVRSGASLRSVL